jgi:glycerol-3-phosphate acyltransferase PlsY
LDLRADLTTIATVEWLCYSALAAAAYLLGAVPTGFLVARARGLDIRATGSGNIGATNVLRTVGRTAGILVLAIDFLKGLLACTLLATAIAQVFSSLTATTAPHAETLTLIAGVAVILGHNYTCWLHFKGGKGIATSAGVMAAWAPGALLIALAAWVIAFAATRYVSLASIAASVALPLATWLTGSPVATAGVTTALGCLALFRHRTNIRRLLDGSEHRFHRSEPSSTP